MLGVNSEEGGLSRRDFLFRDRDCGCGRGPHAVRAGSGQPCLCCAAAWTPISSKPRAK